MTTETEAMTWTPQQADVLVKVSSWLEEHRTAGLPTTRPIFRLMGYAGTGKTTIARECVRGRKAVFAAFTGKAAKVMREKGCEGATTIHRLIYKPIARSREALKRLEEELARLNQLLLPTDEEMDRTRQVERDIAAERDLLRESRLGFMFNPASEAASADVIVIDEVSMVNRQIGEDLLRFGVPVLVLGDPAQLPPVFGESYFINGEPDAMLTDIRRQEADSPVVQIATMVRRGEYPRPGHYGDSVVGRTFTMEEARQFDQVIVGRNRTRRIVNREFRESMGRAGWWPEHGDRLVCLRNDHKVGLLNGSQWTVQAVELAGVEGGILTDWQMGLPKFGGYSFNLPPGPMKLTIENEEGDVLEVEAHQEYFRGEEPEPWLIRDAQCFDYAYAITCHKSQGSQWDRVLVVDESRFFRGSSKEWLYTAVTRAAKSVAIMPG